MSGDESGAREQRRSLRVAVAPIEARFEGDTEHGTGVLKNVSREGLQVRTFEPPEAGDFVHVVFQDLEYRWIEVYGIVRWSREVAVGDTLQPGFGLQLEQPGEDYLAFFSALAREKPADPA